MGYAYRFLESFTDAEAAFKKYTELIPDDPNPYDSYAELLMKMGRFDESIKAYEKALSIDPNFVNSYVGIGNDYLAMGKTEQARAAFAKIAAHARNTGERRLARFWTAASYVHESAADKALDELKAGYALAEAEHDAGTMSGDLVQMGDVLREAGRADEALAKYNDAVKLIEASQIAGAGQGGDAAQSRVRRRRGWRWPSTMSRRQRTNWRNTHVSSLRATHRSSCASSMNSPA